MTRRFPPPPLPGQPLAATRPSAGARTLLALRRSANKQMIGEPGPKPHEVDELIEVAARVPDHHKLEPWRFIVFEGEARIAFGEVLALAYSRRHRDAESKGVLDAARLIERAPVVVCVVSSPVDDGRTPEWEQRLSAGAACQTLLIAANAASWAGCWLTEWMSYDETVAAALDLKGAEKIAGFVYLGTARVLPVERARPDMSERVSRWTAR